MYAHAVWCNIPTVHVRSINSEQTTLSGPSKEAMTALAPLVQRWQTCAAGRTRDRQVSEALTSRPNMKIRVDLLMAVFLLYCANYNALQTSSSSDDLQNTDFLQKIKAFVDGATQELPISDREEDILLLSKYIDLKLKLELVRKESALERKESALEKKTNVDKIVNPILTIFALVIMSVSIINLGAGTSVAMDNIAQAISLQNIEKSIKHISDSIGITGRAIRGALQLISLQAAFYFIIDGAKKIPKLITFLSSLIKPSAKT